LLLLEFSALCTREFWSSWHGITLLFLFLFLLRLSFFFLFVLVRIVVLGVTWAT
jgi:hypothetical protein